MQTRTMRRWGALIGLAVFIVGMALNPHFTHAQAASVELLSWYSDTRKDNYTTTHPLWRGGPGDRKLPDYGFFRSEGLVFNPDQPQPADTIPLYSWYSNNRKDNWTTTLYGPSAGTLLPDYEFVRLEGYIYTSPRPGTVPLVSWYDPGAGYEDNFATTDAAWAGTIGDTREGYTFYYIEGYVMRSPHELPTISEFQPAIPWGGRAMAVTVSPSDVNTAVVAAESGGLFQTRNAGATWAHLDGLKPFRMSDVRYSPSGGSLLLASVRASHEEIQRGGVWRSLDGGATWSRPTQPDCSQGNSAWGIAFMPDASGAYVGTDCGVLKSHDNGATWTALDPDAGRVDFAVYALVAHHGSVDICGTEGHYRYSVAASTWSAHSTAALKCLTSYTHAIDASPYEQNVLFIVADGAAIPGNDCRTSQVFESDDSGANWKPVSMPQCSNRPPFIRAHPAVGFSFGEIEVYFGDGVNLWRQVCGNAGSATATRCASGSWSSVAIGHHDPSDLAYESAGETCALYVTSDGGVHKTTDCGLSFPSTADSSSGFRALQIYEVTGQVHPTSTDLYFGAQDNHIWASPDSGATWPKEIGGEGGNLQIPHNSPSYLGQVLTGFSCGPCSTFKVPARFNGPAEPWNSPTGAEFGNPWLVEPGVYVQYSPSSSGSGTSLYLTTNTGATWSERVSFPYTLSGTKARLSGSPANPTAYTTITRAGGTTGLIKITGVRPGAAAPAITEIGASSGLADIGWYGPGMGAFILPRMVAVNPTNPQHLIAVDAGADRAMKVSHDGGASWAIDRELTRLVTDSGLQPLVQTFPSESRRFVSVSAITFDPTDSSHILVGTEAVGIIASMDGGETWARVPGSELIPAVTSFFFDEIQGHVIVSSYGRGLWKLRFPSGDLGVTISRDRDPAVSDEELLYNVSVTNAGPQTVSSGFVTLDLSPRVVFVASMPISCASATGVPRRYRCALSELAPGAVQSLVVRVRVSSLPSTDGLVTDVAVSSPFAIDRDYSNNIDSDRASVIYRIFLPFMMR